MLSPLEELGLNPFEGIFTDTEIVCFLRMASVCPLEQPPPPPAPLKGFEEIYELSPRRDQRGWEAGTHKRPAPTIGSRVPVRRTT